MSGGFMTRRHCHRLLVIACGILLLLSLLLPLAYLGAAALPFTQPFPLCLVSAVSHNHFEEYIASLQSFFANYTCNEAYLYDLGLTNEQRDYLGLFPTIHVLPLVTKRPYFEYRAHAFKAPMLYGFMKNYTHTHNCSVFFYGDASIRLHTAFDAALYAELDRHGMVAESELRFPQVSWTHPKMYDFFGDPREVRHDREAQQQGNMMRQVQSGLMVVDATNVTLREGFFRRWAECSDNAQCLSPDGEPTMPYSGFQDRFRYHNTSKIYRGHRDDQSAFTFLLDAFFNHGKHTRRRVFLEKYTFVHRKPTGSLKTLMELYQSKCNASSTSKR